MLPFFSNELLLEDATRESSLRNVSDLIKDADCLLIAAGAGMSTEAGVDYSDTKKFNDVFPSLVEQGFRSKYDLTGYEDWDCETKWGYITLSAHFDFFSIEEHAAYLQLLEIAEQKDYFVITSNVDGMFYRNHFKANKIFTPQGSFSQIQCLTPCTQQTWDLYPHLKKLLQTIDPGTQKIVDKSVIPACPKCGGEMGPNIRSGYWFAEQNYLRQERLYLRWLKKATQKKMVILELGAGFNTPGIIRWPMERLAAENRRTHLIRINLEYAGIPAYLSSKGTSIKDGIGSCVRAIHDQIKK